MMNYLELINQFWQKDTEFGFSSTETALYFYLLKVCNSTGWKNPFGQSNAMTIAKFGLGKIAFDNAKNNLKKAGLIDFKPGDGRRHPTLYFIKKVNEKVYQNSTLYSDLSNTLSNTLSDQKSATSLNSKYKRKLKDVADGKPPPPKKTKAVKSDPDTEPFFQKLVAAWFDFNEKKFHDKPSFARDDPKILKRIIGLLKKRTSSSVEWNETTGPLRLTGFFEKAYQDPWLSKHFLLSNLEKQFDKIYLNHASGTTTESNSKAGKGGSIADIQALKRRDQNAADAGVDTNGDADGAGRDEWTEATVLA